MYTGISENKYTIFESRTFTIGSICL